MIQARSTQKPESTCAPAIGPSAAHVDAHTFGKWKSVYTRHQQDFMIVRLHITFLRLLKLCSAHCSNFNYTQFIELGCNAVCVLDFECLYFVVAKIIAWN
jgi:hypothetical protein